MTYRGYVKNGQIVLPAAAALPEGAEVIVEIVEQNTPHGHAHRQPRTRSFEPIETPGGSLAEELVRDRR